MLAPIQISAEPATKDPLEGTIEGTPVYLEFLKELEASKDEKPSAIPLEKQLELMLIKERELNRTRPLSV